MFSLSVKTTDVAGAKRRLNKIANKIGNTRVLFKKLSIVVDQWVQQNFKSEGGKVGDWKKLKAGGRRRKGSLDTSARILQDTGDLRKSFVPFFSAKDAGIRSAIPYAHPHNFGKGSLPKRRMIPEDTEILGEILEKVEDHVRESLKL